MVPSTWWSRPDFAWMESVMSRWLWRKRIAVVVAALAATTVVGPTGAAHAQGGEVVPALRSPVVGGYLLAGTPRFDGIQMDLVTHFFWAFSLVQNGRCSPASAAGVDAVLAERRARPN